MVRFENENWLLGENIESFLASIESTLPSEQRYQYSLISSSFGSLIGQEFHIDTRKQWTYKLPSNNFFKSIDQMVLDIIIPIHKPQHWIAAVISYRLGTIFVKDSLFGDQRKIGTILRKWYQ